MYRRKLFTVHDLSVRAVKGAVEYMPKFFKFFAELSNFLVSLF